MTEAEAAAFIASLPVPAGDAFAPYNDLRAALLAAVTRFAAATDRPLFLAAAAASAMLREEAEALHAKLAGAPCGTTR